jgi:hypothetical protein
MHIKLPEANAHFWSTLFLCASHLQSRFFSLMPT